jgi:large subunit ribosomal protein L15
MKLNELKENNGATKGIMRIGRGIGSGKGKTGGRGGKGQTARSGVAINGFEGGQMPIHRRLPKRGFHNANRVEYSIMNLGELQRAVDDKRIKAGDSLNEEKLVEIGLAKASINGIKLLAKGVLTAKLSIEVTKASKAAIEALEKAGGKVTVKTEAAAA